MELFNPVCAAVFPVRGFMDSWMADRFENFVGKYKNSLRNNDLFMPISSVGGDLQALHRMLIIMDEVKGFGPGIVTWGLGKVLSASTVLLASGDLRGISPSCQFGLHSACYREGEFVPSQERGRRKEIGDSNRWIAEQYKNFTDGVFGYSHSMPWLMADDIGYMTPQQVIEFNLCDVVGEAPLSLDDR